MFYYQSGCGTQAFLVFYCTERNPYGIYAVIPPFIFEKVQGGDYLGKLLDFIASAFIYLCGLYGRRLVFVAMWSVTLGFSVVFLPFILPSLPLPGSLYQHKALLCIAADTILLFILLASALHYTGNMGAYFTVACPVALAGLLYVWVFLAVIRYLKIHPYFRTAMVLGFSGIYTLFINSILHVIIDRAPFQMQPCDFRIWNGDYINGNTTMILFLICILLAAAFTVGGIIITVKKRSAES